MPDEVDSFVEGDEGPEPRREGLTDEPELEGLKGVSDHDNGATLESCCCADGGFGELVESDELDYEPSGDGTDEPDSSFKETEAGEAELPIRKLVKKSLQETISGTGEAMVEKGLELMAHCMCPPAGHLVTLVFEAKEVFGDVVALASQDGPGEMKIPLIHLATGIELKAGLQLGDEDEMGSPRLSVFVVPGDGGLFGGWALERDTDHKHAGPKYTETEHGTPDGAAVFLVDLAQAAAAGQDPQQRAALLSETASRMQSQLGAMPEYGDTSIMVLYDERTDLGMWLARPHVSADTSAWRLELASGTETGLLKARFLA